MGGGPHKQCLSVGEQLDAESKSDIVNVQSSRIGGSERAVALAGAAVEASQFGPCRLLTRPPSRACSPTFALEPRPPRRTGFTPRARRAPGSIEATWDLALLETRLADLRKPAGRAADPGGDRLGLLFGIEPLPDPDLVSSRMPEGRHEDCSPEVYLGLLLILGRDEFDPLVGDIGHRGIRDVVNRGPHGDPTSFARSTPSRSVPSASAFPAAGPERRDRVAGRGRRPEPPERGLAGAIDVSLSPREAALIRATLEGKTPAEIASEMGLTPKTISNEKCRVIQKLRRTLADVLD